MMKILVMDGPNLNLPTTLDEIRGALTARAAELDLVGIIRNRAAAS